MLGSTRHLSIIDTRQAYFKPYLKSVYEVAEAEAMVSRRLGNSERHLRGSAPICFRKYLNLLGRCLTPMTIAPLARVG